MYIFASSLVVRESLAGEPGRGASLVKSDIDQPHTQSPWGELCVAEVYPLT